MKLKQLIVVGLLASIFTTHMHAADGSEGTTASKDAASVTRAACSAVDASIHSATETAAQQARADLESLYASLKSDLKKPSVSPIIFDEAEQLLRSQEERDSGLVDAFLAAQSKPSKPLRSGIVLQEGIRAADVARDIGIPSRTTAPIAVTQSCLDVALLIIELSALVHYWKQGAIDDSTSALMERYEALRLLVSRNPIITASLKRWVPAACNKGPVSIVLAALRLLGHAPLLSEDESKVAQLRAWQETLTVKDCSLFVKLLHAGKDSELPMAHLCGFSYFGEEADWNAFVAVYSQWLLYSGESEPAIFAAKMTEIEAIVGQLSVGSGEGE